MRASVLDLELAELGELPATPIGYECFRFLVRVRGIPVGWLHVQGHERASSATLAAEAVTTLGRELWAELAGPWQQIAAEGHHHELMPISVVVCTRARPTELDGCLSALDRQVHASHEVIVVDNSSGDAATRTAAARYGARYVHEPRSGLDWARNRGLDEARASIVAYIDDDARPDPRWLMELARGFTSPDVHAVTGLVVPTELETSTQLLFEDVYGGMGKGLRMQVHARRGRSPTFTANRYGTGCNMAFRRDALERLGGFDPALDVGTPTGGGGDLDALQRVVESGAVVLYRPAAIVRHLHRRTERELRRQLFDNGRGYSAVLWAAFRRMRGADRLRVLYRYWTWFRWWHLRRGVRRLAGRDGLPTRLILAELAGVPLGPALYWLARRRARRLAKSMDRSQRDGTRAA